MLLDMITKYGGDRERLTEGKEEKLGSDASLVPDTKKMSYKCSGHWLEDHGQALYGVSVNSHIEVGKPALFATVGSNRVTVYETEVSGPQVKLLQCYVDPSPEEIFYTCAWSYDTETKNPVLAAGGARGIVRLLSPATARCSRQLVGHGSAINEVKFHPRDPNLLLSVSKDHALRLWNVRSGHNVAIFGGMEGHSDQVLSADISLDGARMVSAGMDHCLKVWQFDTEQIQEAIALSYTHDSRRIMKTFPTTLCHFPVFSTSDIHRNYVDCCKWFGDFVLSKACDNSIVCWRPGVDGGETTVIHKLKVDNCELWFVRFSTDLEDSVLALGNSNGKIYTWDLMVSDPAYLSSTILTHPKCTSAIRQTSFSRGGEVMIAVCDDSTVWKWDRVG
jgi:polycomb protein EED